jgi:hypothetical protein
MTLRPTEALIFGNLQGGAPFVECVQSVGIDLLVRHLYGRTPRAKSGSAITIRPSLRGAMAWLSVPPRVV